jgi:hypothetical protein
MLGQRASNKMILHTIYGIFKREGVKAANMIKSNLCKKSYQLIFRCCLEKLNKFFI